MKLLTLLMLTTLAVSATNSYSQATRFSLKLNGATVSEVFKEIEENSEFILLYNETNLDLNREVDIKVKDGTVDKILDQLFENTDNAYRIYDRQIVILENKEAEKLPVIHEKINQNNLRQQQPNTIEGKVTDSEGAPLPGVTITIVGTTRGVITDVDGNYSIEAKPTDKLVFSFIGMENQIIDVGTQNTINVQMEEKREELDEVTVVAFGKQKKESVISSISTVKPEDLRIPSSNLTTGFAGRMAGLISYQRSGEPGQDNAEFFIRGVTTFGYKKDPLILIDNNEVTSQDLARIQPDNIASFSIMKDATATALYGSRGANGVILITTKEGKEGKAKINVRYEKSMSKPTQLIELADPITYMYLHNEAVRTRNPLGMIPYSPYKIDNTQLENPSYVFPANDWYDILFKDQAMNDRLNFNISGGGKVARYYLAGSLINETGMLKVDKKNNFNNNIKLGRYMLRSNVNINITQTTEAAIRLHGAFDDYTGPIDGGSAVYNKAMNSNPVFFPPYYAPDDANIHTKHVLYGNYDNAQYNNPYADMTKGYKDYSISQMSAQFELKQQLDFITEGLRLDAMYNINRYSRFDVERSYNPFYYTIGSYNKETKEYALLALNEKEGTEYLGYNQAGKNVTSTNYFESKLNWNRTFNDKHGVGGLLVYTMRERLYGNAGDLQRSLPYRNIGLAGRITYEYDSKYFTELNFGYNGSERFSQKERFGFFPSVGVGWSVSNENFWSESLKQNISLLRLKVTYGYVGNDAIGSAYDRFFYLSNVNMNDGSRSASFGDLGDSYSLNGISISRYPNDDITWETAEKLNIGIELGLWDKLNIQADLFSEYRTNILMDRASIPSTMGLQTAIRSNVGEASSKGVDISLNYDHFFNNDFWISALANFTYATSQFEVFEEPDYPDAPWKSRVGQSLNQRWGYVAERLFVDENEVRNSPTQFGDYKGGDIKYKDINMDGKITELDMVPIGYPTSPEIVYGFGVSSGWKNFDLSCFFQGLARESFWINANSTSPFIDKQRALLKVYAEDHWSEDNRNLYALWPRLSETVISNNTQSSTWFMRDGSFIRLKNVEFGYSLPEIIPEISNARVYFSGTNLLTFSKFDLWDPEMGGNGLGYPIQKVFNLGIQISF